MCLYVSVKLLVDVLFVITDYCIIICAAIFHRPSFIHHG